MATAKKVTKSPVQLDKRPKSVKKPAVTQPKEFVMPVEVKNWIEDAKDQINQLISRNTFMKGEVERLKEENVKLRRANKVMETRVMNMSSE